MASPTIESSDQPEHLSVLQRVNCTLEYPQPFRKTQKRNLRSKRQASRYRTQPVTFAEIKEVDEENIDDSLPPKKISVDEGAELKLQFAEFSRTMGDIVTSKKWEKRPQSVVEIKVQSPESNNNKSMMTLRPESPQAIFAKARQGSI